MRMSDYRLLGGSLALGKSSGNFNSAILLCAACALLPILSSVCSFSVGVRTLHPSSRKYCDIL